MVDDKTLTVWHPDWQYRPLKRSVDPRDEKDETIDWDRPMSQIKVGGFDNMKFGYPEIHSILNWALAYKKFLENWCTLMESYAVVAMQVIQQSKKGVAATKDKMYGKTMSNGMIGDTAPHGQWASMSGNVRLEAVRTAGATTDATEGAPVAKMISAGSGLPITFYGDADVGNMATAATLDRPTELKMVFRQTQWKQWLGKILEFAAFWAAYAPEGPLRAMGVVGELIPELIDDSFVVRVTYPPSIDPSMTVTFPDITEPNATERVRALVMAVTMMGKQMTSIITDARTVALLVVRALGLREGEQLVDLWYPPGQPLKDPVDLNPEPATGLPFGGGEKESDEAKYVESDESRFFVSESSGYQTAYVDESMLGEVVKEGLEDGAGLVRIITHGQGSSGYYPKETIKRDGPKVFTSGTHMYWNHPTKAEVEARPVGDLNHQVGALVGNAYWDESGPVGPGVYAKYKALSEYKERVKERAELGLIEISWRVM